MVRAVRAGGHDVYRELRAETAVRACRRMQKRMAREENCEPDDWFVTWLCLKPEK